MLFCIFFLGGGSGTEMQFDGKWKTFEYFSYNSELSQHMLIKSETIWIRIVQVISLRNNINASETSQIIETPGIFNIYLINLDIL